MDMPVNRERALPIPPPGSAYTWGWTKEAVESAASITHAATPGLVHLDFWNIVGSCISIAFTMPKLTPAAALELWLANSALPDPWSTAPVTIRIPRAYRSNPAMFLVERLVKR